MANTNPGVTENKPGAASRRAPAGPVISDLVVLLIFTAGTFFLYGAVLRNGFLTDDYASLYRISVTRNILEEGFFRPLIDISFGFNYLIGGLHPLGYYLFNFAVHIGCCFGVYKLAGKLPFFEGRRGGWGAFFAASLFLFYPFHNEPLVWLSGRLSSMASLCGVWALYFYLRRPDRFWLPAILFFVGLLAYESIIMMPILVVVLGWKQLAGMRSKLIELCRWGTVAGFYLSVRFILAHVFISGYSGGVLVQGGGDGYGARLLKALGRSFLPPDVASSNRGMIYVFVSVCLALALAHLMVWIGRRRWMGWISEYVRVLICWGAALLPAIAFGVSTHTSEGDRLLYFPSVWFCILMSAWIVQFVKWAWMRWTVVGLLMLAGWVLILWNNNNWVYASRVVEDVVGTIKRSNAKRVVMVNLPDEHEGAFIFRNNFDKALVIHGIDSSKVVVNNSFMLTDNRGMWLAGYNSGIRATERDNGWFIFPVSFVGSLPGGRIEIRNEQTGTRQVLNKEGSEVYYWDGFDLQLLHLQ